MLCNQLPQTPAFMTSYHSEPYIQTVAQNKHFLPQDVLAISFCSTPIKLTNAPRLISEEWEAKTELMWTSFLAVTFCSWLGPIPFSHSCPTAIVCFFLNLIFFQAEQASLTLFFPKCHPVKYILFTEYEGLWGKYTMCRTWNTLKGNIVKLISKNNLQLVPTI